MARQRREIAARLARGTLPWTQVALALGNGGRLADLVERLDLDPGDADETERSQPAVEDDPVVARLAPRHAVALE